ncbi:KpsF/GutQ family sugar-phosphate isomerase [Thiotrichales bacterium 19S3-7]|nr:KpsF/GutQ family sugar-phosphate isomerase [Thiotrichales bacterium 19S3-7]MCF6801977.1 KpsF/GutQ family sugar-phosphate isomerase [Thiotrichales bacterium 19S3-11]
MDYLENACEVFSIEVDAINHVKKNLDQSFSQACEIILNAKGRVIVIGMGKSGHIGNKIAATLASTGTPSFFIHPAEAAHGDFGMITKADIIIAISNSGNTEEIIKLLPLISRLNIPLIAITGNKKSMLAKSATVNLDIHVDKEACPHNLAPTASTTVTLVLGDALAIALLRARGFTEEDFAFSHPAGTLGKRLILRVKDLMKVGQTIPKISPDTLLKDAIIVITEKGLGMTTVVNEQNELLGIFTDGDLRRIFASNLDIKNTLIANVMIKTPKTITENDMATKAVHMMEAYKITSLVVINDKREVLGIIHMHDLLQSGVV